jgi:predicted transcriptional regulator of viral defense system
MTLAAQIQSKIKKLPEGKSFGYADLGIAKEEYQTAAKALERLLAKGIIKKLSKGVFYKAEQTVFGELKPIYSEQLRPYLFENGKRIAYETGFSLYNRMGLTTQMAFRIKIASRSKRISINRGTLKADAIKSYAEVTEANYQLLGFLDALKDIKRIPDCSVSQAVKIMSDKISKLEEKQIAELIKYTLLYPPRVRALLGAILENFKNKVDTNKLKDSLNPFTKIKLGLKVTDLPNINNWNIE